MKTVAAHHARTHLSRLLTEVRAGETIVMLNGSAPVAQSSAVRPERASRPPVGTRTSPEVGYAEDALRPLTDDEPKAWGL